MDWKLETKLLSDREVNKDLHMNYSAQAAVLNGPLQSVWVPVALTSAVHMPYREIFLNLLPIFIA